MSDASVRGKVHLIEATKTFGQRGFRKRLLVLEQDNDRFTNYVPLHFIQDACDTIDEVNVGDELEVSYRLSGRKWQRDANSEVKFFLDAEATGFTVLKSAADAIASGGEVVNREEDYVPDENDDDVPF